MPLQGTKKNPMGQIIQTLLCLLEAAFQVKNIIKETQIDPEIKMQLMIGPYLVITEDTYAPKTQQAIMLALRYIAFQNKDQMELLKLQCGKMDQLLIENFNLSEQVKILTTEKFNK